MIVCDIIFIMFIRVIMIFFYNIFNSGKVFDIDLVLKVKCM